MFGIHFKTKLSNAAKKLLGKNGYNPPKKANTYACNTYNVDNKNISVCTFYNSDGLPVKRIKTVEDIKTNQKETQARFYHYLGEKGVARKLKEINQYKFSADNKCIGSANWRFYHPKSGNIRFSMDEGGVRRNNFLQADQAITDANGITVRPISIAEYLDIKRRMGYKHFVDEPWTAKESITSEYGATDCIQECTAVGVVGEKGLSLNHFNPNNPINRLQSNIEPALTKQLAQQGEKAKVFLIGSCERDYASNAQFTLLDDFFAVRKIPHSKYKTGDKILYWDFEPLTKIKSSESKKIKYGEVTPFYYQSGHHLAYENGVIKLTNVVIDRELEKGNIDAQKLLDKSFKRHS